MSKFEFKPTLLSKTRQFLRKKWKNYTKKKSQNFGTILVITFEPYNRSEWFIYRSTQLYKLVILIYHLIIFECIFGSANLGKWRHVTFSSDTLSVWLFFNFFFHFCNLETWIHILTKFHANPLRNKKIIRRNIIFSFFMGHPLVIEPIKKLIEGYFYLCCY